MSNTCWFKKNGSKVVVEGHLKHLKQKCIQEKIQHQKSLKNKIQSEVIEYVEHKEIKYQDKVTNKCTMIEMLVMFALICREMTLRIGREIPSLDLSHIIFKYLKVNHNYFLREYYKNGVDIVSSWGLSQKYFPQVNGGVSFKNYRFNLSNIKDSTIDILFYKITPKKSNSENANWIYRIKYDLSDFIIKEKQFIITIEDYNNFIYKIIHSNERYKLLFYQLFDKFNHDTLMITVIKFYNKLIEFNLHITPFYEYPIKWIELLNISDNYFEFKTYIYWLYLLRHFENYYPYYNDSDFLNFISISLVKNLESLKDSYYLEDFKIKMLWTVLHSLKKPILEKL